jgi:hypothetical protein
MLSHLSYHENYPDTQEVTMNFFTKLKCLLQFHQGEWTTAGGSGCWQRRRCRVCGILLEQRERHIWYYLGEWTTADGSGCWQRRRCRVCGIIEQRYDGSMFSDAVYLFGTTFSSAPSRGGDSEELPDGMMVSQSDLAKWAVLAAFAYLYHKKLIEFVLEERERKVLFSKTKIKAAIVKKLQSSAPYTSGLEAVIFSSIPPLDYIYGITRAIIGVGSNPWGDVLQIVKENLLQRGILKQVVKGKVHFFTTYKYVVNGDISKEKKQVTELIKTLKELQSKGELYQEMLSDIEQGIASRMETDGGD